jgi:hypothetical protein
VLEMMHHAPVMMNGQVIFLTPRMVSKESMSMGLPSWSTAKGEFNDAGLIVHISKYF